MRGRSAQRVLIADPLDEAGLAIFRESGLDYHLMTAEEKPRLKEMIGDFDALVVRSATKVTADLLRAGRRLKVIGRAGIGVDNVDVAVATDLGVLVVNAPTANLVSATEHTFALILSLARNVPAANASVKAGEWERRRFLGRELNGKTLGLIGLGRIGQAVAARGRAFGMKVIAHDPFLDEQVGQRLGVEMVSLEDVIERADVLTLHVPLTDGTRNLIGAELIRKMGRGAILVNCARGGVVDEEALLEALDSGHLGGAALDVFAAEPPTNHRLIRHPRVVATPHIGAQTQEAQARVATQTARMVVEALAGSLAVTAVNLPFTSAGERGEPFLGLSEQLGRLASSLLGGSLRKIQADFWGVSEELRVPMTIAVVRGALTPALGEAVNFVNAERIADERGIEVVRATHQHAGEYPNLIRVTLDGERGSIELAGTIFGESDPRVVHFGDYRLEFRPQGRLLVVHNQDVPGVVGKVGTLLGNAGVNIAEIHLARETGGEGAMAVIRLDQELASETLAELAALPEVNRVQLVDLE